MHKTQMRTRQTQKDNGLQKNILKA